MFDFRKKLGLIALVCSITGLASCGGGSGTDNKKVSLPGCDASEVLNSEGQCVTPPPLPACPEGQIRPTPTANCITPNFPEPLYKPGINEVVIFVNSENKDDLPKLNMHLWQDCGNGWGSSVTDGKGDTYPIPTSWPSGPYMSSNVNSLDPIYGAYFVIPISETGTCGNFIIKNGNLQTNDLSVNNITRLTPDKSGPYDRMYWVILNTTDMRASRNSASPICINDVCEEFEVPALAISDVGAHWIDKNTIAWSRDLTDVQLYWSDTAGMSANLDGSVGGANGNLALGNAADLSESQIALVPHLSSYKAYAVNFPLPEDPEVDQLEWIKSSLKKELIVVGTDTATGRKYGTRVQMAKVLDELYTSGTTDADENNSLGVTYNNEVVSTSVWAPTALNVELRVYDGTPIRVKNTVQLTLDDKTGIWSGSFPVAEVDRKYYRYRVTVYNPFIKSFQILEVTDPYSVSLSANSKHSQFVNLNDADLKPDGWDEHTAPEALVPEAATIYEAHIRDFSIRDESTSNVNRGKYMAFTELDSAPMQHLMELKNSGLTYIHLLPSNDSSNVDEEASSQINLNSTVLELCDELKDEAPVCKGVERSNATIKSVLESYDPLSADARVLVGKLANLDGFNWGYDPHHFNVPEGGYSTSPHGATRIKEMRAMNKALHDIGLRVVLDVVYPHTVSSGVEVANSVFDKIVPGYYYRVNAISGVVEGGTGAGPDTATENRMMAKFVSDSVVHWAKNYGFDGFRFDQSGFMPKDTLVSAFNAVKEIDEDNYFYAEAWNPGGGTSAERIKELSVQESLAGTGIGTFNDRLRNPMQQLALMNGENADAIRAGLAGNLKNFLLKTKRGTVINAQRVGAYNLDPQEAINYIEKHDNETFWDWMHRPDALPENTSLENRVRIQNLSLSIPLLSQGVPFIHMGSDLLRSKSMCPNSYNAGDWFNYVDFTKQTNNWSVGLPPELRDGVTDEYVTSVFADANSKPLPENIEQASAVFQEFLKIASSSPLFSLQTESDVLDRVGFHDGGKGQVAGLIVMSIDDGVGVVKGTASTPRADLDADLTERFDAVVVVINGTATSQSAMINTSTGFELHSIQKSSVDTVVSTAVFAEASNDEVGGTFTVPAYTTAVFVKPQLGVQGAGLSADATTGVVLPVPYGDTSIYVRGGVSSSGWDATTANKMKYDGDGIYSVTLDVPAGDLIFKIAEADWSSPNLGSAETVVIDGAPISLVQGSNDNIKINVAVAGEYRFVLDASISSTAPSLTVVNPDTFQGEPIYLRGTVTSAAWDATSVNQLTYEGNGIYGLVANVTAGDYVFKVASSDWSTVNMGSADTAVLGESMEITQGSNDNIPITIPSDGNYRFEVNTRYADAPTVKIYADDLFSLTPIYARGTVSSAGWDATADNLFSYVGRGLYTLSLNIIAGDYVFKVAETNWSNPNLGAPSAPLGETTELTQGSNDNIAITIPVDGSYLFTVDTSNAEAITVTVDSE